VSLLGLLIGRELRLAARRRVDVLLPLAFFAVAVALFPFGVGPEPQQLRSMAPGVIWVCALLAAMLSVSQLFAADHADGSLEQMLLAGPSAVWVAVAKSLAHWLLTGLPLALASPLFALMFGLPPEAMAMLVATLLLGTPCLSLLGALGAALTLGVRGAGVLLIIIVLPLAVPALIFGTGAVGAVESGIAASAHLSLLGALLIVTAVAMPWATAAALRIAVE
jgi:heme exporter protein B